MLLSTADKYRFKLLYMELSHREMAYVFNTYEKDIIAMAKELGIFETDILKKRRLELK